MVKPSTPSDVEVNGRPKKSGMVIDSTTAKISAQLFSPTNGSGGRDRVRMNVKLLDDEGKNIGSDNSSFITTGPAGQRTSVTFTGLKRSKNYVAEIRAYTTESGFSNSTTVAKFKVGATAPSGGDDPQVANPPVVPSSMKINGVAETPGMATKTTTAKLSALLFTTAKQRVRMVVQLSTEGNAGYATFRSPWVVPAAQGTRVEVDFGTLVTNTHYVVKAWSQTDFYLSESYAGADFYTNRNPFIPIQVTPQENSQFPQGTLLVLTWQFTDPDDENQARSEVQYRVAGSAVAAPGPWNSIFGNNYESVILPAESLSANQTYEWKVRAADSYGLWSDWSLVRSFYITGTSVPPLPLSPINGEARAVAEPINFVWQFRSTSGTDSQTKADIQYRPVGTDLWFSVPGDTITPGTDQEWSLPAHLFQSGVPYEWQVRTYSAAAGGFTPSDWSYSQVFWGIYTPGAAVAATPPVPMASDMAGLGCGTHRVFIYDQGGKVPRGEITPLAQVKWNRKRDDISNAVINTTNFGADCCALLASARSWMHELVIFRDGPNGMERVFEGPITRVTYTTTNVEIEAKDVMAYAYRRIMRQGYNDAYQVNNPLYVNGSLLSGTETGLSTTVDRANWILVNALARHDPNVLPYLTTLRHPNDARQSRVVPDYAKTAWEEVDDMAAHAGLDYVTVGRRIMLWDTHRPIGKLPEMRDNDFSDPPIVTEYGMNLANYVATTDGSGVWGAAEIPFDYYGPIEMLNSAYAETASGDDAPEETLTPAALERKIEALRSQSQRSIANRWPTPLIVRVPDNVTLNSEVNLSIQQLVPGVWIPLRAMGTCRDVTQWQKLDSVSVTEADGVEQVQVVMSPAPNGGDDDPDATRAAEEAE